MDEEEYSEESAISRSVPDTPNCSVETTPSDSYQEDSFVVADDDDDDDDEEDLLDVSPVYGASEKKKKTRLSTKRKRGATPPVQERQEGQRRQERRRRQQGVKRGSDRQLTRYTGDTSARKEKQGAERVTRGQKQRVKRRQVAKHKPSGHQPRCKVPRKEVPDTTQPLARKRQPQPAQSPTQSGSPYNIASKKKKGFSFPRSLRRNKD